MKNAFLLRILLWLPLGFISASNTFLPIDEAIILPFSTIEAILLEPEVADKMATTDSLGRKGVYLIPDRNMSWHGFKRPNPDTLSLYSFYPEEIWWYRVRHWLEVTDLREKNGEVTLSLRSRQPGQAVKPDYLLRLRLQRTADSLVLINKRIYPID